MKNLLSFLMILLTLNISIADDVVPIEQGQPAPYSGVLFSNKKANETRLKLVEKQYLEKENTSLKRSLELSDIALKSSEEKSRLFLEQNDKLAKNLNSERQVGTLTKVVYFVLGAGAVGLGVWGAGRLIKWIKRLLEQF